MNRCVLSLRQRAVRACLPSRRHLSTGFKRGSFEPPRVTLHSIKLELDYIESAEKAKLVRKSPVHLHEIDFLYESLLIRSLTLANIESKTHPLWKVFELFRLHGHPTIWAYNLVLKRCIETKSVSAFKHIRDIMSKDRVTPDIVTINLLLARAVTMNFDLDDILKDAERFATIPNRQTYLLCLQQFAARGVLPFAMKVFDEMLKRAFVFEPDDEVFRLMAESAKNSQAPTAACQELKKMVKDRGVDHVNWRLCGIRGSLADIR